MEQSKPLGPSTAAGELCCALLHAAELCSPHATELLCAAELSRAAELCPLAAVLLHLPTGRRAGGIVADDMTPLLGFVSAHLH